MLYNVLEQNFFTTPFFIVCVVSIVVLLLLLVLLRVHYRKLAEVNKVNAPTEVSEDEVIDVLTSVTPEEEAKEQASKSECEVVCEETTLEVVDEPLNVETASEEPQETLEEPALEPSVLEEVTYQSSNEELETSINLDDKEVLEEEIVETTLEPSVLEEVVEEENNCELTLDNTCEEVLDTDVQEEVTTDEETHEEVTPLPVVNEEPKDEVVLVERYRKSFLAKLILNKELQEIYKELRDHILSYKKVKARVSFKYERFSVGRKALIKLVVRGKKLYLYLALNPQEQEKKYHLVDVSDKKIGEQLPSLLKVLSDRSVKYAKVLIDKLMLENEIELLPENKVLKTDYSDLLRKRSLEKLIEDGLVVKYLAKDIPFGGIVSSDDLTEEELKEITPEQALELVSTEEATEKIEFVRKRRNGKQAIVNVGALSRNFDDGDYVDLETLMRKHLVPRNTSRIKVLASGTLDKSLVVEADDFSDAAVKMIVYKKGRVIKVH